MILGSAPDTYIQVAGENGGFIIEKRNGSHRMHFRAVRHDDPSIAIFTVDEAVAVLVAWAAETPMPDFVKWERMEMPPD